MNAQQLTAERETRYEEAIASVQAESRKTRASRRRGTLLAAIIFVGVVGLIEVVLAVARVPEWTIPRPTRIAEAWWQNLGNVILPNAGITLLEVLIGFVCGAVIGVVLGGVIGEYQILDKILSPFILILITTPVVALVPLLMLWFGYGLETKIIAAAIASFPPIMMNTVAGLTKTPAMHLDLMKYLGASRWEVFTRVKFLNALPSIFTGLTIGSIFALITTVAAEFVGGSTGLGNRLIYYASTVQTPLMFAIILSLAVIGIIIYVSVAALARRVVTWQN
ncbi:Hydroxymethylpyrimidine ABC transporter, transmembrane component [Leucobacter sp. 7(1)]|uniref:ABC transporter permease n=1 Tax=Leucobacter sp. 7(1) TaxID=1255613 RepID=UPI00097EB1AC|nr:ABC transporter permease [Leucobacter sp. 7(1)]SJN09369.1 Hydroxymethylpyrimidine ABC transporter, transmembrane component [Leucobacter sp. 7(1)]